MQPRCSRGCQVTAVSARIDLPLLVLVGFYQSIPLVGYLEGFWSDLSEESMDFCGENHRYTLRRASHLNFMRVNQLQKHRGLQLDQRSLFRQQRCDRITQIEQGPPLAVPVELCVGMKRGEVCAFHPSRRSATLMGSEKRMGFGSWPIKVERKVLMVFEPGSVEVRIQAIACNESVHIIHAQGRVLFS